MELSNIGPYKMKDIDNSRNVKGCLKDGSAVNISLGKGRHGWKMIAGNNLNMVTIHLEY